MWSSVCATTSSSSPGAKSAPPAAANIFGNSTPGTATTCAARAIWAGFAPSITVVEFDGGNALFDAADDAAAQRVLQRAAREASIDSFAPVRPTLAQIFKEVIQ